MKSAPKISCLLLLGTLTPGCVRFVSSSTPSTIFVEGPEKDHRLDLTAPGKGAASWTLKPRITGPEVVVQDRTIVEKEFSTTIYTERYPWLFPLTIPGDLVLVVFSGPVALCRSPFVEAGVFDRGAPRRLGPEEAAPHGVAGAVEVTCGGQRHEATAFAVATDQARVSISQREMSALLEGGLVAALEAGGGELDLVLTFPQGRPRRFAARWDLARALALWRETEPKDDQAIAALTRFEAAARPRVGESGARASFHKEVAEALAAARAVRDEKARRAAAEKARAVAAAKASEARARAEARRQAMRKKYEGLNYKVSNRLLENGQVTTIAGQEYLIVPLAQLPPWALVHWNGAWVPRARVRPGPTALPALATMSLCAAWLPCRTCGGKGSRWNGRYYIKTIQGTFRNDRGQLVDRTTTTSTKAMESCEKCDGSGVAFK